MLSREQGGVAQGQGVLPVGGSRNLSMLSKYLEISAFVTHEPSWLPTIRRFLPLSRFRISSKLTDRKNILPKM